MIMNALRTVLVAAQAFVFELALCIVISWLVALDIAQVKYSEVLLSKQSEIASLCTSHLRGTVWVLLPVYIEIHPPQRLSMYDVGKF